MRLQTFLLTTALAVVAVILVIFSTQTRVIINDAARRVSGAQFRQLSEISRGVIEARVNVLHNFSQVLRADNDLSGTFILAEETKDLHLIGVKLAQVRKKGGFDFAQILPFGGRDSGVFELPGTASYLRMARKGIEGLTILQTSGGPALFYYAPIKHYGSPVGAIFIGNLLNTSLKADLEKLTRSKVELRVEADIATKIASDEIRIVLPGTPLQHLVARIVPAQSISEDIGSRVMKSTLFASGICLVLLIGLFTLVLELGFARRFRKLAASANKLAAAVSRGETPVYTPVPSRIYENDLLNKVLVRLVEDIQGYQRKIEEKSATVAEANRQRTLAELARQVVHNISSPMVALEGQLQHLSLVPEHSRRAVRNAVNEIRHHITALREKARQVQREPQVESSVSLPTVTERLSIQHLASLVDDVVSERRTHLTDGQRIRITTDYGDDAYNAFARIDISECRAVVSNILNNAIEAMDKGSGHITIRIVESSEGPVLTVSDNGRGIASPILSRIGKNGATFGKTKGSGIGLFHAKNALERWGGRLEIASKELQGTTVSLFFPLLKAPEWHLPKLLLGNQPRVCILDDEVSIHGLWEQRLGAAGFIENGACVKHFYNGDAFVTWVSEDRKRAQSYRFLVDFELIGQNHNGLDLIESLGIAEQSVLVTGRFDETEVLARARWVGVKVLPKPMAWLIPIQLSENAAEGFSRMAQEQPVL